jgi:hypothetical protein
MSEKKAGRPPLRDESMRRDKKVMLTFTQSEYDELKKMQVLLNQATLTATLLMFIDRGMQNLKQEIVQSL